MYSFVRDTCTDTQTTETVDYEHTRATGLDSRGGKGVNGAQQATAYIRKTLKGGRPVRKIT